MTNSEAEQHGDTSELPTDAGPRQRTLEAATRLLRPLLWTVSPRIEGLENVPHRGPALFVGNHTMIFMTDFTIMMLELYRTRGVRLWSVADHFHYKIPLWRDMLLRNGAIDGTYENCKRVLESGEILVVFPGGAREVTKRRGEQYKLLWQGRTGFARLAIETNATVVPFGAIGGDEIYDVVIDGDTIMKTPTGEQIDRMFRRFGMNVEGYLPPVIKGMGPTMIPRIQRLYYQVGTPLSPRPYAGRADDPGAVAEFREEIADAVERCLRIGFKVREEDSTPTFASRLVADARAYLDAIGVAEEPGPED